MVFAAMYWACSMRGNWARVWGIPCACLIQAACTCRGLTPASFSRWSSTGQGSGPRFPSASLAQTEARAAALRAVDDHDSRRLERVGVGLSS